MCGGVRTRCGSQLLDPIIRSRVPPLLLLFLIPWRTNTTVHYHILKYSKGWESVFVSVNEFCTLYLYHFRRQLFTIVIRLERPLF